MIDHIFASSRNNFIAYRRLALVVAGLLLVAACTTTSVEKIDSIAQEGRDPVIALMPLDVEVSLLTAGGLIEPNAEWTGNAQRFLLEAIKDKSISEDIKLEVVDAAALQENTELRELESLHRAVGQAMLVHHFGPAKLPTKKDNFDWSLGENAQIIGDKYNADYAMYVFFRNGYSSGGRVALTVLAAVAGVGIPAAPKYGFASLIDTKTGEVVWFNALGGNVPDIRTQDRSVAAIDKLLKTMPNNSTLEADGSE